MSGDVSIARAALHYWEEPCISGKDGSGAIFFTGCTMHCIFCQNYSIANSKSCDIDRVINAGRLKEIFYELKFQGANNINLVTPDHFVPTIAEAVSQAKAEGFDLPFVYNTSSYINPETLSLLDGLIDVYLPDFKFMDKGLAQDMARAKNYPEVAKIAIDIMLSQVGKPIFECQGKTFDSDEYNNLDEEFLENNQVLIKKGVIVRHLLLPGHTEDSKRIIGSLLDWYGNDIYISIMNQYTPVIDEETAERNGHLELLNRVTDEEYENVIDFAIERDIENGFIQEGDTAMESFIPEFNGRGID